MCHPTKERELTHLQFHVLSPPRALLVKDNGFAEESDVLRIVYPKELIPLSFNIVSGIRILKMIQQYENKINHKTSQPLKVFRILCNLFFLTPKSQIILFSSSSYSNSNPLEKGCIQKSGCFCCYWDKMEHFLSLSPIHISLYLECLYQATSHICALITHDSLHTHAGWPAEAIQSLGRIPRLLYFLLGSEPNKDYFIQMPQK